MTARLDHPEILDDPSLDPRIVLRSMRDVARSNALFGGTRAVLREFDRVLREERGALTMLDVGSGLGDIPAAARRLAHRRGVPLRVIGADISPMLLRSSGGRLDACVAADAAALPFRDRSVEIVMCSQLLHHFAPDGAAAIVREMNRVARRRVIVSDIRRSRLAVAGLWLASFVLHFHPVSRHDGVASIRRGFNATELASLVSGAIGVVPRVRRHATFRITASWRPVHAG